MVRCRAGHSSNTPAASSRLAVIEEIIPRPRDRVTVETMSSGIINADFNHRSKRPGRPLAASMRARLLKTRRIILACRRHAVGRRWRRARRGQAVLHRSRRLAHRASPHVAPAARSPASGWSKSRAPPSRDARADRARAHLRRPAAQFAHLSRRAGYRRVKYAACRAAAQPAAEQAGLAYAAEARRQRRCRRRSAPLLGDRISRSHDAAHDLVCCASRMTRPVRSPRPTYSCRRSGQTDSASGR